MSDEVFIYDAVRTATGRFGGGLSGIRPDDLAATTLSALLTRHPDLDPHDIGDVVLGNANGAGEENRNVARMAVLLAGLPTSVPGATVNRLCASGLEAVIQGSREIAVGDASVVLAGGVESMTRAPYVLQKPSKPFPHDNPTLYSTSLGWRFPNLAMDPRWRISLGESAEILAERDGITREDQDRFAAESHRKADTAWERGDFADEVIPVPGVEIARDESIRPGTTVETLAGLRPSFRPDGTVTAGNSSPLNDGASALLLGDAEAGTRLGRKPMARIVSRAATGVNPDVFGLGPVEAVEIALRRAGIGWDDVALMELNEAFASQSLACLRGWPQLDPSIVNVSGGAIALGHALGSSGSRILTTLVHNLHRRGGGWGVAALCIGMGQGVAMVVVAA
jgi:acetyl-CoA acetyltransferase family protein